MSTYFVENLDRPHPHSLEYPGVRIDAINETAAMSAYVQGAFGAQVGDRLRVVLDGPNYIFFGAVVQGPPPPPSGSLVAKPVLPAVGS